jgi:hypothetical protein
MTNLERELWTLFEQVSLFGDDTEDERENFQDKFAALYCQYYGHQELVPDQCRMPNHDYCPRCRARREEMI